MSYKSTVFFLLCLLFSCDKGSFEKEMSHSKNVFIAVRDEAGNNLLETAGLKIDTVSIGSFENIPIISSLEYSLSLFVNGEEKEGMLGYVESRNPKEYLIFCYPDGEGERLGKNDYIFEYQFACSKLFGDEQTRCIRVELPFKNGYHPITAVYWDDKQIADESSCNAIITVVLDNFGKPLYGL